MSIQIICAWCHRDMGIKEGEAPCPISHGICPDCERKVRAEINEIPQTNNTQIKPDERRI